MGTDCLRCVIGGTTVALPIGDVNKISELAITPPMPLSEPWVGGVSLLNEKVWITVNFDRRGDDSQKERNRKGVLFKEGQDGVRWSLEIDEVAGLGTVDNIEEAPLTIRGWTCPEPWIRKAKTPEGKVIGWIDTASIRAHLKNVATSSGVNHG